VKDVKAALIIFEKHWAPHKMAAFIFHQRDAAFMIVKADYSHAASGDEDASLFHQFACAI